MKLARGKIRSQPKCQFHYKRFKLGKRKVELILGKKYDINNIEREESDVI